MAVKGARQGVLFSRSHLATRRDKIPEFASNVEKMSDLTQSVSKHGHEDPANEA
jgi:hypothetical protein